MFNFVLFRAQGWLLSLSLPLSHLPGSRTITMNGSQAGVSRGSWRQGKGQFFPFQHGLLD